VSDVVEADGSTTETDRVSGLFGPELGGRRKHQSLTDMAAEYIREGVVSGRLGPGAKVDQDQIANALGISRLPVREALIELTAKGFVESFPRRGAFVVTLSVQDIEDHFEVISLLFGLTTRRAAENVTAAQLHHLQQLHTEITTTQDRPQRLALSYEFNRLINRIGTSDRLLQKMWFFALALPTDFYFSTTRWPAIETVYRERILAALDDHDPDAAAKASTDHLHACAKVTIEELRSRGYWGASGDDVA